MTNIHTTTREARVIKSEWRKVPGEWDPARVVLRYDDRCGNGYNTFSITVESKNDTYGGCMHNTVCKVFPEFAHLIKWHLCSSNGPHAYIANTLYFAVDNRVKAAEKLEKARDSLTVYVNANGYRSCESFAEQYMKDIGMLKASISIAEDRLKKACGPDLKAAQRAAIAPDATLEQLQNKAWLEARFPSLVHEFKTVMDETFKEVG